MSLFLGCKCLAVPKKTFAFTAAKATLNTLEGDWRESKCLVISGLRISKTVVHMSLRWGKKIKIKFKKTPKILSICYPEPPKQLQHLPFPMSFTWTERFVSHMGCQVLSIYWMCSLAFILSAAILELRWSTSSRGYLSGYGAEHW